MTEQENEEEGGATAVGRPNSYWKRVRESQEKPDSPDTFGGAFRGVPAPVRKSAPPPKAIGSEDVCWCGQPLNHDWPGKKSGVRHPRKESSVSAMATENHIERRDLRAYHRDLQEVILLAINQYGCRYRLNNNHIILYSPIDNSTRRINARNTEREVRPARTWFAKHVVGIDEDGKPTNPLVKDAELLVDDVANKVSKQVETDVLVELAEQLNGPEHPVEVKAKVAPRPKAPPKPEPEPEQTSEPEPEAEVSAEETEWRPYYRKRDNAIIEGAETNGLVIRCTLCHDELKSAQAIGGHMRLVHEKEKARAQLWGNKSVQERKGDALRYNALHDRVTTAIDYLSELVDYQHSGEKVEQLEHDNEVLRQRIRDLEETCGQVEVFKRRAEEAEAKLALAREAMGL